MLFNSLHYVFFLPLVVLLFFALPPRRRWVLMLAASYYFYMCWKVEYILLIVVSTVIDYFAGIHIASSQDQRRRRWFLLLSLASNLGILFAFKYFNFFSESARAVLAQFNIFYDAPVFRALLPVGISFYTFQTLSYTIEVYRGHQKPERHFGIFALYVSFFPQLVAGPIERSVNLLPQMTLDARFEYARVRRGLFRIAWGLFKKVVIADRVAVIVNQVYNNPGNFDGPAYLIATFLFAYQIYCDFSGYSDIAIGSAELFGVDLMRNFNRPYYAKTIAEFWKRWHISLSTWFRDYLYISLGGNRKGKSRWYFNLFVTFLVSGLWHGAAWTFVIWGALNGLYLIMEILIARPKARLMQALNMSEAQWRFKIPSVFATFILTCIAWVFFRANSVGDALHILGNLGTGTGSFLRSVVGADMTVISGALKALGLSRGDLMIVAASIALLEGIQFMTRGGSSLRILDLNPRPLRWAVYYSLITAILFFGAYNASQQFIYFQF